MDEIQLLVDELREKNKQPGVDVDAELKKIQERCFDLKGEPCDESDPQSRDLDESDVHQNTKDDVISDNNENEDVEVKDCEEEEDELVFVEIETKQHETVKPKNLGSRMKESRIELSEWEADDEMSVIGEEQLKETGTLVGAMSMTPDSDRSRSASRGEERRREIVEKRLKTMMFLSLMMDHSLPSDFLQTNEGGEIFQPITYEEIDAINSFLKSNAKTEVP